jgi:hypothetical protein
MSKNHNTRVKGEFDLESYRVNLEEEEEWELGEEIDTGLRRRSNDEFFLAGPFPVSAVVGIGDMRGKVLLTWLLIHHRVAYLKRPRVTLPDWAIKSWGISQDARTDALKRLVAGGWIMMEKRAGLHLRVSLTAKSKVKPAGKTSKREGKYARSS